MAPSRFAAGLFLAVLLAAPLARAQQLDLGRLQPPSDGEGLLGVEGARPPVEGDPRASVNLWLDNAFQPLVFQANSGARDVLIDNRVESFLGVQLHLWRPLSLAVQLPFLLAQTGDLSTLPPSAQPAGSLGGGVGDLRLTPRLAILRQETAPIDLGAQVSLTLPTASSAAYTGDTRVQFEMLAALARDLYLGNHAFELLGNVLVRLRAPEQIVDVKTGNELGARLGFAWLLDRSWVAVPRRLFVEAEGESALRGSFADGTVPAEWRVGASFCAAQAVSLDLGAGTALGDGIGAPRARVIFGLGYAPEACGQAGRDRFAARAHGAAPPTAALAVGDSSASPDAPTAHVATVTHVETSAAAPNTSNASHGEAPAAATANSPTSASSAPASNPEAFIAAPPASAPPTAAPPADALALPDIDALPAPPLPALVPAPGKSAPAAAAESDALPLTPLVALNDLHPAIAAPLAASGPDRDGDGLGDSFDSCPDQAGPVANHGCPSGAAMQVGIAADRLTLDSRLEFRSGSSALERSSLALLQQLAAVLKSHPEITHLEIRAHTGGAIPEARALALSQERAETVVKFLGGQGISFDRLSAVGLGSTQPIAPNLTAQGRKKNERIELLIGK